MKLHFVRHGETEHNVQAVITSGDPGNPINELGTEQARQAAAQLAVLGVDAVYTSPLLRARVTAEIIAARCGVDLIQAPELRETGVGALEGQGDTAAFDRFNESLDRWYLEEDLDFPLGPGGETAEAALERVGGFLATLENRYGRDAAVVLVSHQTLLQLVLTFLPGDVPAAFGYRRWLTNGGVSTLMLNGGDFRSSVWDGRPISDFEELNA